MNSVTRVPSDHPAPPLANTPSVDVVVPVHNEQGVLPESIPDYLALVGRGAFGVNSATPQVPTPK